VSARAKTLLRLAVTLVLLAWVVRQVDLSSTLDLIRHADRRWIAAGALIHVFGFVCTVWRWRIILRAMGAHVAFRQLNRLALIGTFFSMFLPASIGGDIAKLLMLSELGPRRELATASVMVDRLVGLAFIVGLGLCSALALPETRADGAVLGALLLSAVAFVAGVLVLLNRRALEMATAMLPERLRKRVAQPARDTQSHLRAIVSQPFVLLRTLVTSTAVQLAICSSAFCAGQAFGIAAGPLTYLAIVPISMAVTALPISINGLGVQDRAMLTLFALVGVPAAQSLTLSLYLHAVRSVIGMAGGLVFFTGRRRRAAPAAGLAPEQRSAE
jgi:uncharacterized protein (TIRG00374 family)